MFREVLFVALGGVALLACKQAPSPTERQASPSAPTLPATAAAPTTPPPAQQITLSYALFKDGEVLTCTDATATEAKLAAFPMPEGLTKLKQSCDSLGRTALTTCVQGSIVTKYYAVKYSDKYMAGCVKSGGLWTTNKSPEAQMARAEQELAAAKAAAGIQ